MIGVDSQLTDIKVLGSERGGLHSVSLQTKLGLYCRYELLRFQRSEPEFLTPQHPQLPHASARGRARRLRV
jgi:hypothetical protein